MDVPGEGPLYSSARGGEGRAASGLLRGGDGDDSGSGREAERRGDCVFLPLGSPTTGSERQRQRVRDDSGSGTNAAEVDCGGETGAACTDDSIHFSAGD